MTYPTQDEIVARIHEQKDGDALGFEWHEYASALDADHADVFCKDDADMSKWKQVYPDEAAVREAMRHYVPFAWEKANDCRGISSNRSISHYIAWCWLIGDREFSKELEDLYDTRYQFYGKPLLVRICDKYCWPWKPLDNGRWSSDEEEAGLSAAQAMEQWELPHGLN